MDVKEMLHNNTGSYNGCDGNTSESDSEAGTDSVGRQRRAAHGLRGSRWHKNTPAELLAARTIKTQTCWNVQGYSNPRNGYMLIGYGKDRKLAHRLAYELAHGPIPAGLRVMHSCDNPRCVNPAHLSAGTQKENIRDAVRKGRWTVRKLSDDDVQRIREMSNAGMLQREIASVFGVARNTVCAIVNGVSRVERIGEPLEPQPALAHPAHRVEEILARVFERVPSVQLPIRELHVGHLAVVEPASAMKQGFTEVAC